MNAVECTSINKSFGTGNTKVNVLRGVDFTAAEGEMTFLVGPSGCGKTTLISIIAGLLGSDSGTVNLFGKSLAALSARDQILFRRENLGFVFQQYNLLPSLTAAENAAIPLLAAGMNLSKAVKKATEVLGTLGLGDRATSAPRLLSGGQQQRVALARALVHEPRLIICDEPTAALDHKSGENVMELLASSAMQADRAVLVVTHDSRIFHFADRIAHMDDGVITHVSDSETASSAH